MPGSPSARSPGLQVEKEISDNQTSLVVLAGLAQHALTCLE
jgi:hypothetical protein